MMSRMGTLYGQVLTDRSLIAHSLSAISEFTKQNEIDKNKMKVVKLKTYKTTFGRVYQPFCSGLNKKKTLITDY
jgi:hypothetical protein